MRKDAQAVLLLLIGGTLLKISIAGTYVRYVKPGQLPLLLITGVVLIAIAGVTLWQVIRAPREAAVVGEDVEEASGFEDLADEPVRPAQPVEAAPRLSDLREPPPERAPSLSALREHSARDVDARDRDHDFRDREVPDREVLDRDAHGDRSEPAGLGPSVGEPSSIEAAWRDHPLREPVLWEPDQRHPRRRPDPIPSQEVTYREFTPGELVAVPARHQRAARDGDARDSGAHAVVSRRNSDVAGSSTEDSPATHVRAHVHGEPRIAWLLLLPTLALLLFAPPALGSYQATRNGTALSAQADSDFPPLPAGDPLRISMLDYAGRAVFDQGRSLQGRRVTLSGFVIAGPNGQPYLARMIVTCCAADARPVKVGLAGDLPTALQPDEWIEVVGTFVDRADKDPVNAELVPYIQVSAIHDITAPDEQYES